MMKRSLFLMTQNSHDYCIPLKGALEIVLFSCQEREATRLYKARIYWKDIATLLGGGNGHRTVFLLSFLPEMVMEQI